MSEQIGNHGQQVPAMTRRVALAAAAVAPFHRFRGCRRTRCAAGGPAAEKNAAFMRGDMQRWSELVRIAADFTLMQPFGGPPSRGFDTSPVRMAEMLGTSATARPTWSSCRPTHARTLWCSS